MDTNQSAQAWKAKCDALAEFAWRLLVNRTDVWGSYIRARAGKRMKALTAPRKTLRGQVELTRTVLAVHFQGAAELCGLHSTSPDNTCRWICLDIDKHKEGDGADPVENERAAKALYEELTELGIRCLLIDSNGKGGFHLWVILAEPVPSADAYGFGQMLARDLGEKHGLKQEIEAFPKQRQIERCGNYVRLPGLHHTHAFWSRVWNGSEWLEGDAAISLLLAYEPNPSSIVPKASEPAPSLDDEKPAVFRPFTKRRQRNPQREREIAGQCLEHIPNSAEPYCIWFRVMAASHYAGLGVEDFIRWSAKSNKHDEAKCREDWTYLNAGRAKSATIGTLIKLARDSGFDPLPKKDKSGAANVDPAAVDDARLRVQTAIDAEDVEAAFDAAVDLAILPAGEREAAINELEDLLGRKLKVRLLRREIEQCSPRTPRHRIESNKPKINIGLPWLDLIHATTKALAAANEPPTRFMWSNTIVRLAEDEKGIKLVLPVTETFLRGDMGRTAVYFIAGQAGEMDAAPPMDVARGLLPRFNETAETIEATPFPPLNGLVERPVLRADGTVLDRQGYDRTSGLYYWPAPGLQVPDVPHEPTPSEVDAAIDLINDAIGEFPFEAEVDRTNTWAMLLTVVLRSMVGLAPLAIIDAPQAGTGKSLLARLLYMIANGRDGVMTGVPPTDEEMSKLITSLLIEGSSVILLDNLDGPLYHSALAKAITAPTWSDRQLGSNKTLSVPQNSTWLCTGNNVMLAGDMPRRCYRIRLDAKSSRPWDDGRRFRHDNLIDWASENRGRLIAALLTVCRAWFAAGRPDYNVPRLGSFEAWSQITGNILAHIGKEGFLSNRDEVYESSDEETPQWERFLAVWREKYADRAIAVGTIESDIPADPGLRDALPDSLAGFVERHQTTMEAVFRIPQAGKFKIRLGKALKARLGRRFGPDNLYLGRSEDSHGKVATWTVLSAGSAGSSGSVSSPTRVEKGICAQVHTHTDARAHDVHTENSIGNGERGKTLPQPPALPAFDPDAYMQGLPQPNGEVLQ